MSSTRQPQLNVGLLGGFDGTTPAYLLDLQTASFMDGLRVFNDKLQQFPLMKLLGSMPDVASIFDIRAIPSGVTNECVFVTFSEEIRQLRPSAPNTSVRLLYENGDPPEFTGERFSLVHYNNQIWFTNLMTPLHFTDGTKVGKYTEECPAAAHIVAFYDHLVMGNMSFKGEVTPWRVHWSDLYKPNVWTPTPENEADFFDCVEWHDGRGPLLEVTGLHVVNDLLYVMLPETIVGVRYVGLPKVMHFGGPMAPIHTGVGNSFQFSSISRMNSIYFYDEQVHDFYELSGGAVRSIGMPVQALLKSSTTLAQRRAMIAMVLNEFHEIWWVLPNAITGPRAFIYNFRTQKWVHRTFNLGTDDILCVGSRGGVRAKTIDELAGTCDDLAGTVDALSATGETNAERMFGGTAGRVYREELVADATPDLVNGLTVIYVTGDRFYGDLFAVKEIDSLTLSANADITVSVAIRDSLDDAIAFESLGTWTPALPHRRLTFPKKSGRIWRWAFGTPAPSRGVKISGFQEHVYGQGAEK